MTENILFSYGSLFFSLLLTIVYYLKSKQTNINNKVFTILLLILDLTFLIEIICVTFIYNFNNLYFIEFILSKLYFILSISWFVVLVCYWFTIGKTNIIKNYKELLNNEYVKRIIYLFVCSIILLLFIKIDSFITNEGVYFSRFILVYMYFVDFFISFIGLRELLKNKQEINNNYILIFICINILVMLLQLIYPMYLILTCLFVFDTYICYFMFENPDLYLINELWDAKKNVEKSSNAKMDFLSNMSHEIRTPMNAIVGISESIISDKEFNSDNVKKDINSLYSAGNNLLEIINNILDISKIEFGEQKIENVDYNIENMILELEKIINVRIGNKKIKFILDVNSNIIKNLNGDKTKIYQILLNVLGNAVKYTEVGKIILKVDYELLKDNQILLHFCIEDTGCGIKKEDYDKIFEKFSRLDLAIEKEIEGTGLGLVIVKKLVDFLGGKIWFESEYNVGTKFYIDLIQTISSNNLVENNIIKHEENSYIDCSNYKILLVDDNKLNLKVAEKILSNYKFQINKFDNGKDCINDIKQGSKYDLIFLDHMMPEMDGLEVLHILKNLNGYDIPPIVVLTANAIAGMKEMYIEKGFDDYISKPINIEELDKIINKYFNK